MSSRAVPVLVFAVVAGLMAAEAAYYLPLLPEKVASHFDLAGRANGWQSRTAFGSIMLAVLAGASLMFLIAGLIPRVPNSLINLPNRGYWLAAERREASLGYIRDWMRWFLVVQLALVAVVFGLALRANLETPPRLSGHFVWLMAAYFVVLAGMMIAMFRRYRKP